MIQFQTLGTVELRDAHGREIGAILAQPKRLALLAYLCLAIPRGFHRRDTVTSIFWPDASSANARAALSRAVYQLRSALGPDAILNRGDQEIGVDFETIQSDALLLEDLASAREWRQAADLYRGDLLAGFYIPDAAPEFDHWLDERRRSLRERGADAAWQSAMAGERQGNPDVATRYARKSLALRPDDERQLRAVLELFERAGDRSAARAVYDDFARRLAREHELEPSSETLEIIRRVCAPAERVPAAPEQGVPSRPVPGPLQPVPRKKRPAAWIAVGAIVLLLAPLAWRLAHPAVQRPVLAVGAIAAPGDSLAGLPSLLTTNLARLASVDVISAQRMLELSTRRNASQAAQLAGATDVITGVLAKLPNGALRLDLQRVDARTGRIRASYSVQARESYELIDVAVERIARDLHVPAPADRLEGRTSSLKAYALLEEALRAHYRSDPGAVEKYLTASVQNDSGFAMGWYYLGTLVGADSALLRARRAARASPARERLLIEAEWAHRQGDRRALAIADSLRLLHPSDPNGHFMLGRSLVVLGNARAAIPHLERVFALDSVAIAGAEACRACDALEWLVLAYRGLDSLAAAERIMQQYRALVPQSYKMWLSYSSLQYRTGRLVAAEAALDTAARFTSDKLGHRTAYASVWQRRGNYDAIDALWSEMYRAGDDDLKASALWGRTISFRAQGRLREALEAAREYSRVRARALPESHRIGQRTHEALVLYELGEYEESARLLHAIATQRAGRTPSVEGSHRAWHFAYAAGAYAALGDTATLRALEDSVRINGALSTTVNAQRLHHYVRGLRLARQGRDVEAVRAYREAITFGDYAMGRLNVQLARSLLITGRANEAIPVLRNALRGPVSSVGLSATQTELQELLGVAFERVSRPDSALVQYRAVLAAWRDADPRFSARRQRIEERVAAIAKSRPGYLRD